MSIKFNIELEPFRTPSYVIAKQAPKPRQEGVNLESPKYHISELDAETLGKLCDDFRATLFERASLKENAPKEE